MSSRSMKPIKQICNQIPAGTSPLSMRALQQRLLETYPK